MIDPMKAAANTVRRQQRLRADNAERIHENTADIYTVTGRFLVEGVGSVARQVNFPAKFIEIPSFYFGSEIAPGHAAVDGNFPSVSVIVLRWTSTDDQPNQTSSAQNLYNGANLGVVIQGGISSQKIWIHWSVTGTAVANPVFGDQTAGGFA